MGTNYYIIGNYCPHCGRGDEVHLGKQSMGWKFLFQTYDAINSFSEWMEYIKKNDLKIQDEYKRVIELADFITMVNSHQDGLSACEYNGEQYTGSKAIWEMFKKDTFMDDLGYEFSSSEFT